MKKLLLLFLASTIMIGCQKDRNNDPVANVKEAEKDRDLQGKNFVSDCSDKPLDAILTGILTGGQASIKGEEVSYRFDGANVIRQTRMFTSLDCSGDAAYVFEEAGSIKIGDTKTADLGRDIELDYKSLKLTIATADGVAAANAEKICDQNNWGVGDSRDVSGESSHLMCYGASVPRHVSNIYRVDAGVLYFGTITTGSVTEANRPTSLDRTTKFTAK